MRQVSKAANHRNQHIRDNVDKRLDGKIDDNTLGRGRAYKAGNPFPKERQMGKFDRRV